LAQAHSREPALGAVSHTTPSVPQLLMALAFLSPAAAPVAPAPVPTPAVVEPALAVQADAISLSGAAQVAGAAAVAAGALATRGMQRRSRTQRKVAATMKAPEAPPPPPPFQPSKQVGAMAPLGYFDPLGFAKVGDEAGFQKLRVAEIKHGRVAMMASVGLLGQHFIRFPFFEKAPAGLKALASGEGFLGFLALFVASGFLELAWREEDGREAGNYGNPFGINMYNEEMRNKEISNGRFAMICVLGIFSAELASGKDAIQQFGF